MNRSERRRLSWSARILAALAVVASLLVVWAFWWEPGRLVVHRERLALPGWSAGEIRVALLADLHVGSPRNGLDNLRRVVRRTSALDADVVLLAGDLVISDVVGGRFVPPEAIALELGRLESRYGTFAVLGNHDRWLSAERVANALAGAGIAVLENAAHRVVLDDGSGLWLVGVSDAWTGRPDIPGALAGVARSDEPVILFTHNPDLFAEVPDRVALTLAGHTHGGQVVLPFVGRAITPSRFGRRYAAHRVRERGRTLFVTTGVGTSRLGVRFLVPPEIALLRITP